MASAPGGTTTETRADPGWLAELREQAGRRFDEQSLPVQKDRGWEFTDLSELDLDAYEPAGEGDLSTVPAREAVISTDEGAAMLAVDAALRQIAGSDDQGVTLSTLAEAAHSHGEIVERHLGSLVSDRDKFTAQNLASFEAGAFVHVARDTQVAHPITVTTIQSEPSSAMSWRTLIVVEPGAEVTVVEQYMSSDAQLDAYFNPVTEIVVGEGAKVSYLCVQDLSQQTWILGSQRAQVAQDATLHWIGLGLGSGQGKLRMETDLRGRGSHARVTGAYAARDRQHLDYETTQEHFAPDTTSDLAFRGILRDRATAVWSGMIKVDPPAQRTDAFQENRNLLLTEGAHADAIPGLEIEADDVRCTHAATISKIDEEQLFYLRSRGLDRSDAERLLVGGFLEAIAARLDDSQVLHGPVTLAMQRELERLLV
ncbi:MAG: Fe-S cluster assembly protein SufD [Solirubrobacterales bacterium]